jgi:hypothetical protein
VTGRGSLEGSARLTAAAATALEAVAGAFSSATTSDLLGNVRDGRLLANLYIIAHVIFVAYSCGAWCLIDLASPRFI